MRATEFITEDSFNGIDIDMDIEGDEIMVTAMANGRELGHVLFVDEGEYLMPQDLEVDERFQGQGIAAAMYDYVKSKGYKIRRSGQQTDAGAGFWGKHRPEQNVWEDAGTKINFTVQKSSNKFATTMTVNGKSAGVYQYNADTGRSIAEVYPEYRGKGLGKVLVLHAIYTAAKLGMDFVEDESRTSEYDNVLDSLSDHGYIVDDDGYWYVTGAGEQFLKGSLKQNVTEGLINESAIFLGPNAVIVGQEHGKPLKLSDQEQQKIKDIAERHGAWYEGNGMDQKHTKGIIDDYKGSWDDDLLSPSIKGYPSPFLYVLFSNIKENDTVDGKIGFDPKSTIFDRILDTQPSTNYFPDRKFDAETLQKFLKSVSEDQYDFVKMSQAPATEKNVRKFFTQGEKLMFPDNWEEYPYRAGRVAKSVNDLRDKFLATRKKGVYVAGSDHLKAVRKFKDKS